LNSLVHVAPPFVVCPIQKPSPQKSLAAATAFSGLLVLTATEVSSCGRAGSQSSFI